MDAQQFREFGKAAIDLMADYVENIRDHDVLPSVEPGYLINALPQDAPEQPEDWKDILKDFNQTIMPGITHWQSPQFHAFYPTGSSYASIVGNILGDGLSVIGLSWGSASEATLVALLAAKDKTVRRITKTDPTLDEDYIKPKLVGIYI
ncbi:hypothetical protein HW555_006810 [Spodoptera exigua]|uniref:Uncharacterized protein n=1 Tax=Spodoptera exigua TaxID=7107 RepID=A0A835L506_SPOEX|nr:hypothetical protein HW555_006810 [Spodoptera exigua]